MAYDKEKLYALLTELKFEDIFCGDLVLLEHKLKAAANMSANSRTIRDMARASTHIQALKN